MLWRRNLKESDEEQKTKNVHDPIIRDQGRAPGSTSGCRHPPPACPSLDSPAPSLEPLQTSDFRLETSDSKVQVLLPFRRFVDRAGAAADRRADQRAFAAAEDGAQPRTGCGRSAN